MRLLAAVIGMKILPARELSRQMKNLINQRPDVALLSPAFRQRRRNRAITRRPSNEGNVMKRGVLAMRRQPLFIGAALCLMASASISRRHYQWKDADKRPRRDAVGGRDFIGDRIEEYAFNVP